MTGFSRLIGFRNVRMLTEKSQGSTRCTMRLDTFHECIVNHCSIHQLIWGVFGAWAEFPTGVERTCLRESLEKKTFWAEIVEFQGCRCRVGTRACRDDHPRYLQCYELASPVGYDWSAAGLGQRTLGRASLSIKGCSPPLFNVNVATVSSTMAGWVLVLYIYSNLPKFRNPYFMSEVSGLSIARSSLSRYVDSSRRKPYVIGLMMHLNALRALSVHFM